MARKIKGWVDQFSVHPHQREQNENITVQDHKWLSGDLRCTLVVTDERVFTESEVRAYEKDLTRALSGPGAFTERHREEKVTGQPFEETVSQWVSRARSIVRAKHGLSDPV